MVYINRNRYIYVESIDGVKQKAITLGKADMSLSDLWALYKEFTEVTDDTLEWLVNQYTSSKTFKSKKSHVEMDRALTYMLKIESGKSNFGAVKYKSITPGTIRNYLDYRNNIAGNREIEYLSSAWSYCYQRDIVLLPNPCFKVSKIKETPRTRYVTDDEYMAVYKMSQLKYIRVAMELAVTCRMRRGEVLDLRVKDIELEGVNTRRLKGSITTRTLWNSRLRKAVDSGLAGCIRVPEMPVVNNGRGQAIGKHAFKSAWSRLMAKAVAAGIPRFTFHDLKAVGVSNYKNDAGKQLAGGHKSAKMTAIYDRKRKDIEATD